MQQKKCGRCKQEKDITEFKRQNSSYCRECQNEYTTKYQKTGRGWNRKYYAVYRGDEFLCMGYKEECAEYLGVEKNTISFWTTPSHKKRVANCKSPMLAIVVEED